MKRTVVIAAGLAIAFGVGTVIQAGTQSPAQAFESASIKPNNSGSPASGTGTSAGGLFRATNATLKLLVMTAFRLQAYEVAGGPNWLETERFDILAKPEDGMKPTSDQVYAMLQSLLADRFKLQFHREPREVPVFVLLAGKTPKLEPAKDPSSRGGGIGRGRVTLNNSTLDAFAKTLGNILGRPLLNRTGIVGSFDLKVEWTPDPLTTPNASPPAADAVPSASDPLGPSIFTAIQEQLGLKLEAQRGLIEVFVIDKAEKPAPNNER